MELTSLINLLLAFAMVLVAVYAGFEGRPWVAGFACLAFGLNLSQFILHQQPG